MEWKRDLIWLGIYLAIFAWIIFKEKKRPEFLRHSLLWTGIFFLSYSLYLELENRSFYLVVPLLFLLLFCLLYFRNKTRLINGFVFNLFLISLLVYWSVLFVLQQSILLGGVLGILAVLLILALAFGIYGLIIFLIWNSVQVLRRESRSLANLLTLLLALGLIALLVINSLGPQLFPSWLVALLMLPSIILFYFAFVFWNFLSVSLLYQFNSPKLEQDFIIVLGAGLIDGKRVTPLLAKRIERAITFYHLQKQVTQKAPKILMSGGQGPDEKISEAAAMRNYAIEKGIPEADIVLEANSTTTYENMKFSREIITKEVPNYHAIFSSNNYHIFRAGIFAHQVGLKADGIGAKTAFYYLPNAFLREFAAVILLNKKLHFIVCGVLTFFVVLTAVLQLFIH